MGVDLTLAAQRRAVFLDRDGVLNRVKLRNGKPHPPDTLDEFELLPGVENAARQLADRGFLLFVVTNQPDVARGTQDRSVVDAMNAKAERELWLDGSYVCFHDDIENCACRKPKPGLLQQAAREHDISLAESYMIGDRWRDVGAGQGAGCKTVWIDCGYNERGPSVPADATVHSLPEAVSWILQVDEERK